MQLPTSEHDDLRAAARGALGRHGGSDRIRATAASDSGHDESFWNLMGELGWLAITVPDDFDGLGRGLTELCPIAEEFGAALQPSPFLSSSVVCWALGRVAGQHLQRRVLPQLAAGAAVASWSVEHPGATGTVTVHDGRVSGVRRFVADAHVADHLLIDVLAADRRVLALVDMDSPGVRLTRQHTVDLMRRYWTVEFDGTPLAGDALCAAPTAADELFLGAVALQCAESVGVARRLLEMTIGHVSTRRQFGRQIGSFQAVKHRIADMYVALEGASVATAECISAIDAARSDAAVAAHVAKSWTGRAASTIASEALQLHGGIGFTWEHDLHLFLRRAKVNELLAGSPGWHDERLFDALAAGAA